MYTTLNRFYPQTAETDSKVYPCTSLPVASQFFRYDGNIPYMTREPFSKPPTPPIMPVVERKRETKEANLLPVLDSRFNLREICKQCILLEDHLTHEEKRCRDCCIKHFLALEALCEEAVTLDNTNAMNINMLPQQIRHIQKKWHEDPHQNAHQCAQLLRELRKNYMENTFDIIFQNSCSSGVCSIK